MDNQFTTPPTGYPGQTNEFVHSVANEMARNMKFVGIFSIISGIVNCLTCIGAIFGIPIIFAGIRIREAADTFVQMANSRNYDNYRLQQAFEKTSRFFFIHKIIIIISLIFVLLYIVGIIFFFLLGGLASLSKKGYFDV